MAVAMWDAGALRTEIAGVDLSAKEGFAVIAGSSGTAGQVILAGTAGIQIMGVVTDPVIAGRTTTFVASGECRAVAGAAVVKHAKLAVTAAGKFITATTGQVIVGQALEAASADLVLFTIELFSGGGGLAP